MTNHITEAHDPGVINRNIYTQIVLVSYFTSLMNAW